MKQPGRILGGFVSAVALSVLAACGSVAKKSDSEQPDTTSGGDSGEQLETGQDGASVGGEIVWGGGGGVLVNIQLIGDAPSGYYHDEVAAYAGIFAGVPPSASKPPGLPYLVFSKTLPAGTLNEYGVGYTTNINTNLKGNCFLFVDVQLKNADGDIYHLYYRWMKQRERINKDGFTVKLFPVNKITPNPVVAPAQTWP